MKHQLGSLAGEDETITGGGSTVDLVGKVDGLEGSSQVGDDTSHSEVESLLGGALKAKSVFDNFLKVAKRQGLVICPTYNIGTAGSSYYCRPGVLNLPLRS